MPSPVPSPAGRPPSEPPPLLLVAHGSRDARHAATVHALCRRLRALRPGLGVTAGFLGHCAPGVVRLAGELAAQGATEAVALPLLLTHAHHARSDLPTVLHEVAERHTRLVIRRAAVLGPSALLLAALERRLAEAGVCAADRATTGIVLASAGSTDPAARALVARVAQEWQRTGWHAVRPAFASACPPGTADAVHALRAAGAQSVAVAPYLVAPGILPDRIAAEAAAAGADRRAAVLGDAPELARLLLLRYDEARAVRQPEATGPAGPDSVAGRRAV